RSNPVWSPDSKTIAFLSTTTPEDIAKEERKKKKPEGESKSKESEATKNTAEPKSPEPESEHESDAHVINRAVYRDNDEGYLDPKRHNHIWVLVPTTSDELTKPRRLTTGEFDEAEPFWSHDGSRIYFITRRIDEPYYELPTTDMYSVPSAGGDLQKLATVPIGIRDLALTPNALSPASHGAVTPPS